MLPSDPMILLSYINMKLRDSYPSLREFCVENDVDKDGLTKKLEAIGCHYDEKTNQFR